MLLNCLTVASDLTELCTPLEVERNNHLVAALKPVLRLLLRIFREVPADTHSIPSDAPHTPLELTSPGTSDWERADASSIVLFVRSKN